MRALIKKVLNAAPEIKEAELSQAYIEASQDSARLELFDEWDSIDVKDWEWREAERFAKRAKEL